MFFFHFHSKKPSNIISKFNDNFSEDFFEVLHISVGQKMTILETRPDIFSKNAKSLLKSSHFELQKCNAPQNNPQKNRHKSHV